ncbi:MAG TPA: hypothetical protein VGB14_04705, partial [Acidimicrobiales bacterium]
MPGVPTVPFAVFLADLGPTGPWLAVDPREPVAPAWSAPAFEQGCRRASAVDLATGCRWPVWLGHGEAATATAPARGAEDGVAGRRRALDEAARRFAAEGWCTVDDLVPPAHVAALGRRYRRLAEGGGWALGDAQVDRRRSVADDPVALAFHRELTATVAALAGRPLRPSYSFVCAYEEGATLARHHDRPQCEVTVSLAVDRHPADASWPFCLDAPGGVAEVRCRPGQAVVLHRSLAH